MKVELTGGIRLMTALASLGIAAGFSAEPEAPWREPGQAKDPDSLRTAALRYSAEGHEIVGRGRTCFNNRPLYGAFIARDVPGLGHAVYREGHAFNHPLVARTAGPHPGPLPPRWGFRERMLIAMRNGRPDRVPVAPDMSNMIPCRLTGKAFWDIDLDQDPPLWRAYMDAARHFNLDGWLYSLEGFNPLRLRSETAGEGGGFILSTGDPCGRDTPDANVRARVDAGHEFGVYPLDRGAIDREIRRLS